MNIGTIPVKTFNGVIIKLEETRYVPVIKKYLISINTLEARVTGYHCWCQNNVHICSNWDSAKGLGATIYIIRKEVHVMKWTLFGTQWELAQLDVKMIFLHGDV